MDKINVVMNSEDEGAYIGRMKFFCPACFKKHELDMPPYQFTGTTEKPTLNKPYLFMDKRRRVTCAGTIEDGFIEFSTTCEHYLAGQKAEMVDYL